MGDIISNLVTFTVDFFVDIFTMLLTVAVFLLNLVLTPLMLILESLFPNLQIYIDYIPEMFQIAGEYGGWIISAFGVPQPVVVAVSLYYSFIIGSSLATFSVKLFFKWKKALIV